MDAHNYFALPVENGVTANPNQPWQPTSMYGSYPSNLSTGGGHSAWANGVPAAMAPGSQNSAMNGMSGMNPIGMMMAPFAMGNMMPNFMMPPPAKAIGSADDDTLLVKTLREADSTGKTYKQALDSLHSQNGHTAATWKDYYLDHASRINGLVKKTTKKPNFIGSSISSAQPKASSPTHSKSISSTQTESVLPQVKKPFRQEHPPQLKPSRHSPSREHPPRRPDNLPAFGSSMRLASRASKKNASILVRNDFKLPPVPSREPSPPTKVVAGTNGNKFTAEDKRFFIEHVMYELSRDPSLTKSNLCTSLAQKAGHHTYTSWGSFWNHNPHPADKILAYYHEQDRSDDQSEEEESDYGSSESSTLPPSKAVRRDPLRRGPPIKRIRNEIDQEEMGYGGGPITKADKRAVAKHIASFENWDKAKSGTRWKGFHEKYPQRSAASWSETYRRYKNEIHAMLPKYRTTFDTRPGNAKTFVDVDAQGSFPMPTKRIKVEPTD